MFFIYLVCQQITNGSRYCCKPFAYRRFDFLDAAIRYFNSIKTKVPAYQVFLYDDYFETELYFQDGYLEPFLIAYCHTDSEGEIILEKIEEDFFEDFTKA